MKPPTVFLGEMTNPELEQFLTQHHTVIVPEYTIANIGAAHTAYFFTSPGSVYWATRSGTWGESRDSTPEKGREYLDLCVKSTLDVLENIEKTFTAMPVRE